VVIALAQCTFLLYYNPVLVSPGTLAAEPCVVCTRLITYFQYSVHYFILDSKAVRTQVRICGPLVPFVNKNRTLCHFYRVPSRTPRRRQLTPASRRRGRIAHRSPPCPRPRVLESRQTQSPGRSRGCRASQSGLQPYVTRAATVRTPPATIRTPCMSTLCSRLARRTLHHAALQFDHGQVAMAARCHDGEAVRNPAKG